MNKTTRFLIIAVGILALTAIGGALIILREPPSRPTVADSAGTFAPKPAPDFQLVLLTGEKISLRDYRGKKPVVLNFWASWCPPCRAEATVLAKVARRFDGKVVFLGVAINDSPANAKRFIQEFGVTYLNGLDPGGIGDSYGITGIPETFWIDKRGQIINHWIGPIEENDLVNETNRLL